MVKVNTGQEGIAMQVKKKLGRSSEYGQRLYGGAKYGEYNEKYGIYRIRGCSTGQFIERKRFYIPANPRSEPQQANRSKFANAISGWQNLTNEQKNQYNERAKRLKMSGYNLYIKIYMLSE
jgi:hypothetical protein